MLSKLWRDTRIRWRNQRDERNVLGKLRGNSKSQRSVADLNNFEPDPDPTLKNWIRILLYVKFWTKLLKKKKFAYKFNIYEI
jgi:hypothetical protein